MSNEVKKEMRSAPYARATSFSAGPPACSSSKAARSGPIDWAKEKARSFNRAFSRVLNCVTLTSFCGGCLIFWGLILVMKRRFA